MGKMNSKGVVARRDDPRLPDWLKNYCALHKLRLTYKIYPRKKQLGVHYFAVQMITATWYDEYSTGGRRKVTQTSNKSVNAALSMETALHIFEGWRVNRDK